MQTKLVINIKDIIAIITFIYANNVYICVVILHLCVFGLSNTCDIDLYIYKTPIHRCTPSKASM